MTQSIIAPKVLVNPRAAELGRVNTILWGRAKQYHVAEFPGPLSIKSVIRGSAVWSTSEAERLVTTTNYLVLNAHRPYSITIDAQETVETIFFRQGFVEDIARTEQVSVEAQLDSPGKMDRVDFFETLHPHDSFLSPLLRRLHEAVSRKQASQAWLEDQFFAIARALFGVDNHIAERAHCVPAAKASTRQELYRRLLRGKDYMDSFCERDARLETIARVACVSPYHFHRLFRSVFHETPNEYLQRKRLANARELLNSTERTITDISLAVGFESSTSFSALFRRTYGCSPREYRGQRRNK